MADPASTLPHIEALNYPNVWCLCWFDLCICTWYFFPCPLPLSTSTSAPFPSPCCTYSNLPVLRTFLLAFFLHTRKNQEKKGLIMVTSKLVVRLPPHLHTPSPVPLDSFCWTRTKTKSGKVDGFLCCGSCCCCWCFSAAAFAVDFPLYLYTNFLFALLFFLPRIFFRCVLLLFYSRAIFGVKNAFNPFPTSPLAHFPSPTPFAL